MTMREIANEKLMIMAKETARCFIRDEFEFGKESYAMFMGAYGMAVDCGLADKKFAEISVALGSVEMWHDHANTCYYDILYDILGMYGKCSREYRDRNIMIIDV